MTELLCEKIWQLLSVYHRSFTGLWIQLREKFKFTNEILNRKHQLLWEAAAEKISVKNIFLKISQNLQENSCVEPYSRTAILLKRYFEKGVFLWVLRYFSGRLFCATPVNYYLCVIEWMISLTVFPLIISEKCRKEIYVKTKRLLQLVNLQKYCCILRRIHNPVKHLGLDIYENS